MLEGNVQLARSVEEEDKIIDSYYESSLRGLSEEVITRDKAIEALFARHVERIADHATYIAKLSSLM
ncbi:PhoU domain protein [compost metagenome]